MIQLRPFWLGVKHSVGVQGSAQPGRALEHHLASREGCGAPALLAAVASDCFSYSHMTKAVLKTSCFNNCCKHLLFIQTWYTKSGMSF